MVPVWLSAPKGLHFIFLGVPKSLSFRGSGTFQKKKQGCLAHHGALWPVLRRGRGSSLFLCVACTLLFILSLCCFSVFVFLSFLFLSVLLLYPCLPVLIIIKLSLSLLKCTFFFFPKPQKRAQLRGGKQGGRGDPTSMSWWEKLL